jgi:Tol biopolymer transport system component
LIAFGLRQRLCIAKADGSEQRIIAEVGGAVFSPHWSPDGRKLTFSERRPDQDEYQSSIWQVGADGSNLHRLLDGWNKPRKECCGVWTPDGEFLIFQSVHGDRTDLYALPDRQGFFAGEFRSPVRLTSGTQSFSTPAVSPDGKHLFAIGKEPRGELVRYDSKSGEFIRFLRGIDATWVSFSRSGRKVAYISDPDLTVWRANIDGDMKSQVTFSPQEADGLSWSPDGKWFAMRCRSAGKPWNICLVLSIGGDPTPLIPSETEQAIPTWSADSKRIAFGDVPPGNSKGSGKEAIHILRLSDRTITDLPGSRGLYTARWSPDGHLFCALTIVGHRLKLYDFQTKKWRETEAEAVDNPTWSHDGKYIYYDREAPHRALCRVRVADGHVDPLVDLRDTPVEAGWWSGVTLDNSPLILENIGTTEIYSLTLDSSR